jgi:hypothetical protein
MADFAVGLRTRLVNSAPVAAIVGTKIYPTIVDQDTDLPYVRYQVISDPRPQHLQGYDGGRVSRVQIDCFSASYIEARDLAEKIIAAVATPAVASGVRFGRVKAEGPRDLGEELAGTWIHRTSLDLLVEHTLA